MSTHLKPGTSGLQLSAAAPVLKISRYEQVASWLIAFLVICGTVTVSLLLVWWGNSIRYQRPTITTYLLTVKNEGNGRGENPPGVSRDEKGPGDPARPMLDEPAGSELFDQVEPASALVFAEAAATDVIAEVGDIAISDALMVRGPGFYGTSGGQNGPGDNRLPGPPGDGVYTIPRYERWEMQFTSASVNAYAQQLDSFRIEVAALGGKPEIDYAFNLAKSKPDNRTGLPKSEKRLYMTWKGGALQQFDRTLLTRAGIEHTGRLVVQFYPPDVEKTLADVEQANAPGRSSREFLKTVFGVRPEGDTWEFFVVEQTFRTMPAPRPTI